MNGLSICSYKTANSVVFIAPMWLTREFLNFLADLVIVVQVAQSRCLFHRSKPERFYHETKAHTSTQPSRNDDFDLSQSEYSDLGVALKRFLLPQHIFNGCARTWNCRVIVLAKQGCQRGCHLAFSHCTHRLAFA